MPTDVPDLDALEALAQAATPGPWKHGDAYNAAPGRSGVYGMGMELAETQLPRDAAFIAAAHPSAVLALVAEVRVLRSAIDRHVGATMAAAGPLESVHGFARAAMDRHIADARTAVGA